MLKAWEGVFTAVSRKREPSAGLAAMRQSSPCGLLKHPLPTRTQKALTKVSAFCVVGGGGFAP